MDRIDQITFRATKIPPFASIYLQRADQLQLMSQKYPKPRIFNCERNLVPHSEIQILTSFKNDISQATKNLNIQSNLAPENLKYFREFFFAVLPQQLQETTKQKIEEFVAEQLERKQLDIKQYNNDNFIPSQDDFLKIFHDEKTIFQNQIDPFLVKKREEEQDTFTYTSMENSLKMHQNKLEASQSSKEAHLQAEKTMHENQKNKFLLYLKRSYFSKRKIDLNLILKGMKSVGVNDVEGVMRDLIEQWKGIFSIEGPNFVVQWRCFWEIGEVGE